MLLGVILQQLEQTRQLDMNTICLEIWTSLSKGLSPSTTNIIHIKNALFNRTGHSGAAVHDPRVTKPNVKYQLQTRVDNLGPESKTLSQSFAPVTWFLNFPDMTYPNIFGPNQLF